MNPSSEQEGVIKYTLDWVRGDAPSIEVLAPLLVARKMLFERHLIGWDEAEQVGFGNLSIRGAKPGTFIISGTQTSGIAEVGAEHFTTVTSFDHERNTLRCEGPVAASSEALTHAMIYDVDESIGAVVHVHHEGMWRKWMGKVPTTDDAVEYGTQAMAAEVRRLFATGELPRLRLLVMRGHHGGLISFGSSPDDALQVILQHFE